MKTRSIVMGLLMTVWLCSNGLAQERSRQYYSPWFKFETEDQYICKYYFKPNPEQEAYQFQYVVWVRSKPNNLFFLNKKNEYWCAASTRKADFNKWNVFGNNNIAKTVRIGDLPAIAALPDSPPPIPETAGTPFEAPMTFPTTSGLPLAARE
jgi:hypothetical protein